MALMAVSVSLYSQKPKPLGLPVSRSNTNLHPVPNQRHQASQSHVRACIDVGQKKQEQAALA
jgi:hypothetical protein